MAESLKDKVVVVIGASSGIGRVTAELFAKEGARVMASARREVVLGLITTKSARMESGEALRR